jgi:RimJ/RimL family protein N-acetyltransferase
MTRHRCIHDKSLLEAHFRRSPILHLYELGDLDDFFWPYTSWYALPEEGDILAVALVYSGSELPVLLAMAERPVEGMRGLLESIRSLLPVRFYAHLSEDLVEAFGGDYRVARHGTHLRMRLARREAVGQADDRGAAPLGREDLDDLLELYAAAYPGNWFDPRMLETGAYHGVREKGRLISVAGVHVYSPAYRVAALGNITTHPLERGRGAGGAVTAAVCRWLLSRVDSIGLNVHEGNAAAIRCYERLGFERHAAFGEYLIERER